MLQSLVILKNNLCKSLIYYFIDQILFICLFSLFLSLIAYIFTFNNRTQNSLKLISIYNLSKYLLLISLSSISIISFVNCYIYIYVYKNDLQNRLLNYDNIYSLYITSSISQYISIKIDLFGLVFSSLAFFVALVSLLALDTRFYSNNGSFIFTCNLLSLVIYMFTLVDNYFILFVLYELLLIPSFLFVYFVSPGKRSIQASIYFVI